MIDEIKETLSKATPSPWEWRISKRVKNSQDGYDVGDLTHWHNKTMPRYGTVVLDTIENKYGQPEISACTEADAKLIENAPVWISFLISSMESQKEELEKLREIQRLLIFNEEVRSLTPMKKMSLAMELLSQKDESNS